MSRTEPGSHRNSGGVYLRLKLSVESGSRRSPDEVCLQSWESRMKSGSRRSPGGVFLQLKSKAKFGSRRSPGGVLLQLKLAIEPGSRRSPGRVLLELKSRAEPGSRRSPGGVLLEPILLRTSAMGILYPTPVPLLSSLNFERRKYREMGTAEAVSSNPAHCFPQIFWALIARVPESFRIGAVRSDSSKFP